MAVCSFLGIPEAAGVTLWLLKRARELVFDSAGLLYLLPPLHRADEVYVAVSGTPVISAADTPAVPWPLVAWFGGYGILCYIAGLIVLRFRRLAIV